MQEGGTFRVDMPLHSPPPPWDLAAAGSLKEAESPPTNPLPKARPPSVSGGSSHQRSGEAERAGEPAPGRAEAAPSPPPLPPSRMPWCHSQPEGIPPIQVPNSGLQGRGGEGPWASEPILPPKYRFPPLQLCSSVAPCTEEAISSSCQGLCSH